MEYREQNQGVMTKSIESKSQVSRPRLPIEYRNSRERPKTAIKSHTSFLRVRTSIEIFNSITISNEILIFFTQL